MTFYKNDTLNEQSPLSYDDSASALTAGSHIGERYLLDNCMMSDAINPELIDDESDFFYDEPSWEGCCEDSIEDKEQQACSKGQK